MQLRKVPRIAEIQNSHQSLSCIFQFLATCQDYSCNTSFMCFKHTEVIFEVGLSIKSQLDILKGKWRAYQGQHTNMSPIFCNHILCWSLSGLLVTHVRLKWPDQEFENSVDMNCKKIETHKHSYFIFFYYVFIYNTEIFTIFVLYYE